MVGVVIVTGLFGYVAYFCESMTGQNFSLLATIHYDQIRIHKHIHTYIYIYNISSNDDDDEIQQQYQQ